MTEKPVTVDVFSGCGGLSQGLEGAGFDVVAGVDYDDAAINTFSQNHDAEAIECDLSDVEPGDIVGSLSVDVDDVDAVVGGPPCQGFSRASTNDGHDERNELYFKFLDIVDEIDPDIVIAENVPALLNHDYFSEIVERFESMGFEVCWSVLDASNHEVAQYRERLFVVASASGFEASVFQGDVV